MPTHIPEIRTMTMNRLYVLSAALLLNAAPALAQNPDKPASDTIPPSATPAAGGPAEAEKKKFVAPIELQNFRPIAQRGINVFETPREAGAPYTGLKLNWAAAFTQQMQGLSHETSAESRVVGGVEQNNLVDIGAGFNTAVANVYLGAQLAPGIRVALTSYLSSRHHNETWVKDGYLLIDQSPFAFAPLEKLMEVVTIKAGHFEVNYGDAHFRRSDNGNAMYNPFVGNMILDAFTTEIGGEVLVRKAGFLAMGGVTGGEI